MTHLTCWNVAKAILFFCCIYFRKLSKTPMGSSDSFLSFLCCFFPLSHCLFSLVVYCFMSSEALQTNTLSSLFFSFKKKKKILPGGNGYVLFLPETQSFWKEKPNKWQISWYNNLPDHQVYIFKSKTWFSYICIIHIYIIVTNVVNAHSVIWTWFCFI